MTMKYTVRIDFVLLSSRAVIVNLKNGEVIVSNLM